MSTSDPFQLFLDMMEVRLYVPMFRGYKARIWTMFGLLTYTLLVALLFIALTVRDLRQKKNLWVWRVIERPQGRYFIVNQYLYYPFGTAVTSIVWVPYVHYLQKIMFNHIPAQNLFYWIYLHVVPAFCHAYLTTAIVLGSANLIASKNSSRHLLPPWASNGLLMLLPGLVVLIVVPAVLAGTAWKAFIDVWEAFGAEARAGSLTARPMTPTEAQAVLSDLGTRYGAVARPLVAIFNGKSRTASIAALTAIAFVILMNLIGAVTLVFRLGRSGTAQIVPRDAPVVAPLAPLALTPPVDEEKKIELEDLGDVVELEIPRDELKAEKLPWTVTLFYLCTIPFSVVFVLYASWIISPAKPFSTPGAATEFAATGIVGAKSFLDALSITSLLVKRLIDARKPSCPAVVELLTRPSLPRRTSSDELDYPHLNHSEDERVDQTHYGPRSMMQIVARG